MFIKITSKEKLIEELRKRIGKDVVIHYNCAECDDEQVTYDDEVTEEMIDSFNEKDYIMVTYECTHCGSVTKFLHWDYVQGIEEDF